MIFKQETVKSWFSGMKSSVNTEVIQPFQNAEQVIWKYNQAIQHNSLTQKGWERLLAQSDDGLKAYLTSIKGTTASMTGYTTSLQGNITGFKKVSTAINQYNILATAGVQKQNEFSSAVAITNGQLGNYLRGLNGSKASLSGYVSSLVGATAKTVALQAATMALNAAVSMGLMTVIQLAIQGFDKLMNSAKRASEAADEAFSESNDKVQQNKEELKSLDELIAKYKELKENEELDVEGRKEVKELQNSIADLVGVQASNLDLVNGKLDDEIKKLDEISAKQAKNAYETATANYNNSKKSAENATGDSSIGFVDGYAYVGKREKEAEKILQDAGYATTFDRNNNMLTSGVNNNIFSTIVQDIYDNEGNILKGAQEKADYLQAMIDVLEQNGQRATDLYAGLIKQRDDYLKYIDDQQNAANSLVNSWITYSQFSNKELSKINVNSVESFENYRKKMIEEIQKDETVGQMMADGILSKEDLETAINDYMATSINFSTWYEQWIKGVQNTSNTNEITVSSLSEWLSASQSGEEDDDSTNSELIDNYVSQINSLKEKISNLSSITKDELYELSNNFNDISLLNIDISTPEGLEELRKKLEEIANNECVELENALSSVENSTEKKNLLNYIIELRDGVLDVVTVINGVDTSILSKNISDITNTDAIKALDDISESMSALDTAYAEFKDADTKNFSLDAISGLQEQFGNLDGFDEIISKIDKLNTSTPDIQKAFDDLATAYINQSGILRTVNKDTADLITVQLKGMGIANAESVVQEALKYNLEQVERAKIAAKDAGVDLLNVTAEEIVKIIDEGTASQETTEALADYVLGKQLANKNEIDTTADINNLVKLAVAAGIAVNSLAEYQAYKKASDTFASNANTNFKNTMSGGDFDFQSASYEKGALEEAGEKAVDAIDEAYKSKYSDASNILSKINSVNYDGGSKGNSDSGKGSKSSAENFSEQIDWCAQSISVLTANLQKLQSELENTQGWDKQIAKLKEIYKTNKNLTNSYKTNYKAYKNYYDKVTKKYASTYKKYGAKIEKGETFSIENFKGKNEQKTYNQIQKMIEAYNNYQSAYNQYLDQKVAQQEAKDAVYQKQADEQSAIIESKQALLENTKSYSKQKKIIEDIMSATANQYKYELKLAKTQSEKNKLFQEYLTNMQELGKQSAEEYWTAKDEKIEKYDNRNEVLNATLENTSGADAKNTIADQILENEKSKLKQQRSSVKTAKSEKNELYDKIDKKYKNNVDENGRIVLDNITNISEAQLKYISKYNGFVDTLVEKEQELATSEQEYITAKADNIITHANNIIADADNQIALIESKQSALENYRSLVEAKGNSVAKGYYEDQIAYEKQSAERMEETRKQLVQQLNLLETGSDKWFEVFGMIENCDQSIADSTLKTQEFANAIKEIDLTVFENLKNDFETLAGEADFLIELMSDSEMTKSIGDKELKQLIKDGDFDSIRDMFSGSGLDSLTEEGMATVGLHGASYNAYMNEAYEIQKKRNELAKEMSEDETKNTEENKKLLAEYGKSLQETILKAHSEGKAAVDIVNQGYQDQLNILQEIIDAKKKSLDAEKKIYDYQKNIKSQTKNIMSLRMQLDAWSNVDTEEAKNKVQQLQVEIEDAETELEETVYDQYLSDYEELMDEFYSEYEDMISGYLDNTNALLSDILAAVNGDESSISKTLESLASTFGITLSETMKGIFNADDGKDALGINLNASTKPNADTGAGNVAQNFEDNSNKEQEKKEEEYRKESAPPVPVTPESTKKDVNNEPDVVWSDVINVTNPSELKDGYDIGEIINVIKDANIKTGVLEEAPEVVSQPLTYATDLSEIKKYINSKASKTDTNKNKLSDLNKYIYDKTNGKILSKKEIFVLGNKYLGLNTSDNPSTKEKNAILKALKKSGYSNGGFADELNKVVKENGDDGIVTLQRKELVLTKAQSNDYLKLMDNLDALNNMFDYAAMSMQNDMLKNLTPIPNASVLNNATVPQQINAEFNFTLPNVTDTSSFLKAIQTDNNIQKAIQNVSVGRLGGSGKLSVNRFK